MSETAGKTVADDVLRKAVWDAVEVHIEGAPTDGINAEGAFSLPVKLGQEKYVDGLRAGRLAALGAVAQHFDPSEAKKALVVARERIDARRKEVWGIAPDIWSVKSDLLCVWQGLSEAIQELDDMIEPGKAERELRAAIKAITHRPRAPTPNHVREE